MTQKNIPREPYPPEVMGRLGEETYQRDIRRQVEPHHNGQIVAIDVDAQKWALGADEDEAVAELHKVHPQAFNILCRRAGYRAVYSLGGGSLRSED